MIFSLFQNLKTPRECLRQFRKNIDCMQEICSWQKRLEHIQFLPSSGQGENPLLRNKKFLQMIDCLLSGNLML